MEKHDIHQRIIAIDNQVVSFNNQLPQLTLPPPNLMSMETFYDFRRQLLFNSLEGFFFAGVAFFTARALKYEKKHQRAAACGAFVLKLMFGREGWDAWPKQQRPPKS